jgi:hypothetical protein
MLQVAQWQSPVSSLHPVTDGVDSAVLMCSQIRILAPLCKVTYNCVWVSLCGVQFWMIWSYFLSSSKVFLQQICTYSSCRRDCPKFGRMCLWINEVCVLPTWRTPLRFSRAVRNFGHGSRHNWPTGSPGWSPRDCCVRGWIGAANSVEFTFRGSYLSESVTGNCNM